MNLFHATAPRIGSGNHYRDGLLTTHISGALSPDRHDEVVRSHWAVENQLHGRLDVVMNEDHDRTRLGNGPNNLAVVRHMALDVMQKDAPKGSLRGKFKRAGRDDASLSNLIALF
jgi:predicted transposase YbfD/YdcC